MRAHFYYFRESGKYYTDSEGAVPDTNEVWTREQLLEVNGGHMPGLSTTGEGFNIFVVPDKEAPFGWPQMLRQETKLGRTEQ